MSNDLKNYCKLWLTVLSKTDRPHLHKQNMLGRPYQEGDLERLIGRKFDDFERVIAARSFEELKRNGFIEATYIDLVEPENWIRITDAGRNFLASDLKDHIDLALTAVGPQLVEMRSGMHNAASRTSPDAPRQAIGSARELLDQLLKEGAPTHETRKQRLRALLEKKYGRRSNSDLAVVDAIVELVEAEHNKSISLTHSRQQPSAEEARLVVEATERALALLL